MAKTKKRKMKQYHVLQVNTKALRYDEKNRLVYEAQYGDFLPISENMVYRNTNYFEETNALRINDDHRIEHDVTADGEMKTINLTMFMVVRNNHSEKDNSTIPEETLKDGVIVKYPMGYFGGITKHFKRVLRSSSQYRTGKITMTWEEKVDPVRAFASYNILKSFEGQSVVVAKIEPYISLALSSSLSAGSGWTFDHIADIDVDVSIKGALALDPNHDDKIIRYDQETGKVVESIELTDGQSMMSPYANVKASFRIGQITKREYNLVAGYCLAKMPLAEQVLIPNVKAVWDKVSSAMQFRFGLDKGLLYVCEHGYYDNHGNLIDFVFASGSTKGRVDIDGDVIGKDIELCINNISPVEEKNWGNLNYQFVNALDIGFDDLKILTDRAYERLTSGLNSAEDAIRAIGMIDNGDEEAYEEVTLATKLRKILSAHPRAYYSKWVQKQLKKLVETAVMNMKKGRIPLDDARFAFIITDPTTLTKDNHDGTNKNGLLQPGEYYYNGKVGQHVLLRSPLLDRSEPVVIECVNRPELQEAFGHLKNIIILNAHDDTLPRMGGADTDGDKVLITSEPIVVNAVAKNLPMVFGDTADKTPTKYLWENGGHNAIYRYDRTTLGQSQIGIVTDYATTHLDISRNPSCDKKQIAYRRQLVALGRIMQGKIIDDSKRGTDTRIPELLKIKVRPHWLKNIPTDLAKAEKYEDIYHSCAPLGQLYDYVTSTVKDQLEQDFRNIVDYKIDVLNYAKYDIRYVEEVMDHVTKLEERYRQELSAFFKKYRLFDEQPERDKDEETLERRNLELSNLMDTHIAILNALDYPATTIGACCLHVAMNQEGRTEARACSYPFVVGFEHLICLLQSMDDNFKLTVLTAVDEDILPETIHIVDGKAKDKEGNLLARSNVDNGAYEVYSNGTRHYLKVPVIVNRKAPEKAEDTIVQFVMKAVPRAYGYTNQQVMELVKAEQIDVRMHQAENGEWLCAYLHERPIAGIGKESRVTMSQIQNNTMTVTNVRTYKGVIQVTATVTGEADELVVETTTPHEPMIENDNASMDHLLSEVDTQLM